ncbi:hypothetical protein XOC_3492 [Xanthomonas oryzae pv. oryzicola BLS256]|uniref:Uncharacterized protein n=1 Tax=Xanthomonas oryzae pv. oryzicola (strain BLS256) TaxID=383407 RepID=G7TDQ8_XANOB|nr:hypothetical protein XOC_3492 [Xanthomonas oryzae pv. oryzicola BLS256]QEO96270.1 hypothetical protein XOCgx_1277 [Xanthomonas oryzae pv. oryzicola]
MCSGRQPCSLDGARNVSTGGRLDNQRGIVWGQHRLSPTGVI